MFYLSERQYGLLPHRRLLSRLKNSSSITRRLKLSRTLDVHRGCVNTICWNDNGSTILSGSDDQHLIVTDPYTSAILSDVHSGHRENIFSAKFLPHTNDRRVVSCSGDGVIFHTDFDRPSHTHSNDGCFTCHGASTAYEVRVFSQTPNLFLSCSDDCTVRLYDLRTKSHCLKDQCSDDVLIRSKWGITSMDVNPMNSNEIVCACSDSSVRLYDHRKLSAQLSSDLTASGRREASINGLLSRFVLADRKEKRPPRVTSVVFNRYGTEILASYSSESLYLLDPKQSISHEQSQARLSEHRQEKRTRSNLYETKSTASNTRDSPSAKEQDKKASQFKRLRLRGDWSDTGPDARPSNDEESEPAPSQQENSAASNPPPTAPNRNLQNFFMQRMSDILTQLAAHSPDDSEPSETATTPNESNVPGTLTVTEVNSNTQSTSPAASDPIVQLPPSPPPSSTETSANTTTGHDPNEDENTSVNSRERSGFFNVLFGGDRRRTQEDDEVDDDDESSLDEDGEDEDSPRSNSAAGSTDDASASGRARRPLMAAKWDRIMKRREAERRREENLLRNVPSLGVINSFDGHRNARTMIKEANFWSDTYVMSGSDCGHVFIWNKFTGQIVRIIDADKHVVNCVQPHPLDYPILACSGIDYNIKLFSPLAETPIDDSVRIRSTVKRNHAMLEETSSTITVPATFMFRMLTSFYRLRRPEGLSGLDDNDDDTESTE